MSNPTENNPALGTPRIIGRPDLPTLYIDQFIFTRRPDGMFLVSGSQDVPGTRLEQLRFLISPDMAKSVIENLAKLSGYYPVPENRKSDKKK